MGKSVERLKKHLLEIAEAVNAFDSEAVQVKVISRLIAAFPEDEGLVTGCAVQEPPPPSVEDASLAQAEGAGRKSGLTKFIKEEIHGNYFETARTLAEITDHLAEKHDSKFYTYQTSGILLGLVNRGKLKRETDLVSGGYLYSLPTE